MLFFFQFHLPFCYFEHPFCLFEPRWNIPLHFPPCLFTDIRVPPNNSINANVPSLGPRLSLFSEVSYFFEKVSFQNFWKYRGGVIWNILQKVSVKLGVFTTLPGIPRGLSKKWKIWMEAGRGLTIMEFRGHGGNPFWYFRSQEGVKIRKLSVVWYGYFLWRLQLFKYSLQASSPGRSGDGAGKGRRAC